MRPIPPTLKDRPRYCFVPEVDRRCFIRIEKRFGELFGTVGLAAARLELVSFESNGIIIRVENDVLWQLRCAIVSMPEPIGIVRVSGTLARLREKLSAGERS